MTTDNISRRRLRRFAALAATAGLVAGGAQAFAEGDEEGSDESAPAGELIVASEQLGDAAGSVITTNGANLDPTVLTKFIPSQGFMALQGDTAAEVDTTAEESTVCTSPGVNSGGNVTDLWAGVELPDGSQIKRILFYGQDSDAAEDITVQLYRTNYNLPFVVSPAPQTSTRESVLVTSFTTTGAQTGAGVGSVVASDDNLAEQVGTPSPGGIIASTNHRFHQVRVRLRNAAAAHVLCGVEVQYQVPASAADPGTVFHPVGPIRVFDSRIATYPGAGPLLANGNKVIPIHSGFDLNGVAVPSEANLVPVGATAVTYNIAVTETTGNNFASVTAGDAASFSTAAINYGPSQTLNNGATVAIAADRTIKVWGGATGTAQVIIDITGFYAPANPLTNMGN